MDVTAPGVTGVGRLEAERYRRGYRTLSAMSTACGIGRRALAAIERGESWPSDESIERIATALGVSWETVAGWVREVRVDRYGHGGQPPRRQALLEDEPEEAA